MADRPDILILNGPNLNMLGVREPQIYGSTTLAQIQQRCEAEGELLGLEVDFRQTNFEGEMVSIIQQARDAHDGIIINAGAYTHTSVAVHDALALTDLPVIELHLSNTFKREPFRHHSYISDVAVGVICGFGAHGYLLAMQAMAQLVGVLDDDGSTS
ncbi:3-dehydroquinate dehydratase [Thalassobaculum fulvum]|uniref:3-dehydroquinate dehydratase n=1 Tax=Thalassobaculum fulvum TaxID=1633335 RepID=A0A918XX74_9PROT|nr:type II 3-dehydroquinate dehydratase [Thalassobaculum fulvum]GHD62996.1 3-dehydroquinate dehydratase [Thalassobaculum fulvum]